MTGLARTREDGTPSPWQDRALCAETDPELFFPQHSDWHKAVLARAVCARCPVVAECREAGLYEADGIWGGLTANARRRVRGLRRRAQADDARAAKSR